MNTIQEVENYIRNIIGIPYVNLERIDIEVCNEIVNALEEIFSLYPLLKKSICAIGQTEYIEEHANLINSFNNDVTDDGLLNFKWVNLTYGDISVLNASEDTNNSLIYLGICLKEKIKNNNLNTLNELSMNKTLLGLSPKHCTNFKFSMIYHEIGHIFDSVLKITEKPEFLELLQTIDIEKEISMYATANAREAFAEAFAEYHATDQPNKAVKRIVEFGLAEYKCRAEKKSEIFDVSRKFR